MTKTPGLPFLRNPTAGRARQSGPAHWARPDHASRGQKGGQEGGGGGGGTPPSKECQSEAIVRFACTVPFRARPQPPFLLLSCHVVVTFGCTAAKRAIGVRADEGGMIRCKARSESSRIRKPVVTAVVAIAAAAAAAAAATTVAGGKHRELHLLLRWVSRIFYGDAVMSEEKKEDEGAAGKGSPVCFLRPRKLIWPFLDPDHPLLSHIGTNQVSSHRVSCVSAIGRSCPGPGPGLRCTPSVSPSPYYGIGKGPICIYLVADPADRGYLLTQGCIFTWTSRRTRRIHRVFPRRNRWGATGPATSVGGEAVPAAVRLGQRYVQMRRVKRTTLRCDEIMYWTCGKTASHWVVGISAERRDRGIVKEGGERERERERGHGIVKRWSVADLSPGDRRGLTRTRRGGASRPRWKTRGISCQVYADACAPI